MADPEPEAPTAPPTEAPPRRRQQAEPVPAPLPEAIKGDDGGSQNEHWAVGVRKTINRGLAAVLGGSIAAATGASLLVPTAFATGGAIGKMIKGGKSLKDIVDEGLLTFASVGTVLPGMTSLWNVSYPFFDTSSLLGKSALGAYTLGPFNLAFAGSYHTAEHLYSTGSPQGLGAHLKEHTLSSAKRFAWVFAPSYLSFPYIPDVTLPFSIPYVGDTVPNFAAGALPAGIIGGAMPPKSASEKLEEKVEKDGTMMGSDGYTLPTRASTNGYIMN